MNPSVERALCSASRLFLAVSCQPLVSDMIRLDVFAIKALLTFKKRQDFLTFTCLSGLTSSTGEQGTECTPSLVM